MSDQNSQSPSNFPNDQGDEDVRLTEEEVAQQILSEIQMSGGVEETSSLIGGEEVVQVSSPNEGLISMPLSTDREAKDENFTQEDVSELVRSIFSSPTLQERVRSFPETLNEQEASLSPETLIEEEVFVENFHELQRDKRIFQNLQEWGVVLQELYNFLQNAPFYITLTSDSQIVVNEFVESFIDEIKAILKEDLRVTKKLLLEGVFNNKKDRPILNATLLFAVERGFLRLQGCGSKEYFVLNKVKTA